MNSRLTAIERAFKLAKSGEAKSLKEIRLALKAEGYPEDGSLYGRSITSQLLKLIKKAGEPNPDGQTKT